MIMSKTAFITGMTGQDGPYLAKFLLEKGYKVYGLVKRYSNPNFDNMDYLGVTDKIELITGDITDENCMNHLMKSLKPNEVYNLAAQSFVGASWDLNKLTTEVNSIGPLNILNAIKNNTPDTRYYQASTSELYGNANTEGLQDENTPFKPRSPYGVSKLYAYWMTVNFRESYSLHASNGILFNHESPIRGETFVTRKITRALARINLGLQDTLYLGNMDAKRDWGHARDYVEMQWLMLQQDKPEDFCIASGVQYSVRDFVNAAADELDMQIRWEGSGVDEKGYWVKDDGEVMIVAVDPRYFRPTEVETLLGDPSNAKAKLGWEPKTTFDELVAEMVQEDLKIAKRDEIVKDHGFAVMDYNE